MALQPASPLRSPRYVVADFGAARRLGERAPVRAGTLWYRPPELTLASVPVLYSTGVDGWALGCVVYEALLGLPAFDAVEESIGRVHLHFFTPSKGCFCRGCKASRAVSSLKGTKGLAMECVTSLLQRAHQRVKVTTIAARLEEMEEGGRSHSE